MDDRAERLRRRRKQTTAKSHERAGFESRSRSGEPSDSHQLSKPSKPADGADAGRDGDGREADDDRSKPVKEQQIGTYMYLPETQVKHLRRRYNVLKAEYEFEYNEEFEKNRHFYPLVVQYGLERLDELDASQIRSRLQEFY